MHLVQESLTEIFCECLGNEPQVRERSLRGWSTSQPDFVAQRTTVLSISKLVEHNKEIKRDHVDLSSINFVIPVKG